MSDPILLPDPEDEPQANPRRSGRLYALGMLASIALVLIGLFVLLPIIFLTTSSKVLAGLLVFLIVPMFPGISGWLQGEYPPRRILAHYTYHLADLFSQLAVLALALPFIAATIGAILTGIFLFAIIVGLVMWVLKFPLGIPLNIVTQRGELPEMLSYLFKAGALESLCLLLVYLARRYRERFFDWYAGLRRRAMESALRLSAE